MTAVDELSLSFTEHRGFRYLMELIVPEFKVPDKNVITRRISMLSQSVEEELGKRIQDYKHVSLTTDGWTSRKTESYICITLHSVSKEWKLDTHTLCSAAMPERHTADNLREHIEGAIRKWNLEDKVIATVHDNAANITACTRKSDLMGSSLPCFAHTLQCAVNNALQKSSTDELLRKVSRIVSHFKHSTVAKAALTKAQKRLKLPLHELIQSCRTRWNASYYMINRTLEQKEAIISVLEDEEETPRQTAAKLKLTEEEWAALRELDELLEPLEITTTVMSSENNVTLSMARPLVHSLLKNFYEVHDSDSELQESFKEIIQEEFFKRFLDATRDRDQVALMATYLDPR